MNIAIRPLCLVINTQGYVDMCVVRKVAGRAVK